MRRLGVISIVLLGMAFAASTAAWSMYQYARATRGICKCEDCEHQYFGSSAQLDPPWAFMDRFMHGGRRLSYPERVFLTPKRDPAGVLPITSVQVVALLFFVIGSLCAIFWVCIATGTCARWLLQRPYRWLFALDLPPPSASVPAKRDASSN